MHYISNIIAHLDEHKLLSDKQHAVRKLHFRETQLTTLIDDWAKILDKESQIDTFTCIFDSKNTFETLPLMNSIKTNCLAMKLEEKQ